MPNPKKTKEKEEQLNKICSNQFELITPYTTANDPITVIHLKCGKQITYKQADTILRSGHINCSCEKHSRKYTQESFEKKVHEICPDIIVMSPYVVSYEEMKFLYVPDGVIFNATPQAIYKKEGYPFNKFGNTQIIKGINDLWTTHPHIAKYLNSPDDGYLYKYGTDKKLKFKCPDCNKTFDNKPSKIFNKSGVFICCCCNDGISYPEKVMYNLLNQLDIDFIWQFTKKRGGGDWCQRYQYDFYLIDYNTIIEVNGIQHYEECFTSRSLIETQQIDKIKKELALSNGIKNYIVIDARKSEFEWIKSNIINSEIARLVSLKNVDWEDCKLKSTKSIIILVGKDWDKGMHIGELATKYKIDRHTIRTYLLKCDELGILKRSYAKEHKRNKKVQCVETQQVFNTIKDAQIYCNPNVSPNGSRIAIVLGKKDKTAYGYHWIEYK